MKINLLDCTLRDGGYYNNWDFPNELVQNYLNSMADSAVEYVELGFRFANKNTYMGPCAYTTDLYINSLKIPKGIKLGIMLNAKDIISSKMSDKKKIRVFFNNFKNSKISFVRFACHLNEVQKIINICDQIKKFKIKVIINLMQISELSDNDIQNVTKLLNKSKVDVFYFADSLGSLDPKDIVKIISNIKLNWKKPLGFHAHDNMGKALINGITAFNEGASWIDSTVTGMGRGAGNIKTEYALIEFSKYKKKPKDSSSILKLIDNWFKPMKVKYDWGTNYYYYLAGKYKIHPTFIQSILADLKLEPFEILSTIKNLNAYGAQTYNKNLIEVGKKIYHGKTKGNWAPNQKIKGKDVLIIGAGPSSTHHVDAIEKFILKNKPFVIGLNYQKTIQEKLIDIRVACHTLRLTSDIKMFKKITQPLVLPLERLSSLQKKKFGKLKILNYGLQVKPGEFQFKNNYSIAPNSLTIVYALCIANSGNAKNIFVTGLDGYPVDDPRRYEMDEMIKLYLSLKNRSELISITPTRYKIRSSSVYANFS